MKQEILTEPTEQLFAEERQRQIVELLMVHKKLIVVDLCKIFDVTPPTIRSDLKELEARGLLQRTHGGAILNSKTGQEMNFSQREVENIKEKRLIAKAAADIIHDGDTIIIDSGTTTLELTKCLAFKKKLTIITIDFKVAAWLEDNTDFNIFFLGGFIKRDFHCTIGPEVVNTLQTMCADKCIIGTTGITAERGISTPDAYHAEIRRKMMSVSSKSIVLADSRKLGKNAFSIVAPLNDVDTLVIDNKINPSDIKMLEDAGITVIVANDS